jgi:hypothetical protein
VHSPTARAPSPIARPHNPVVPPRTDDQPVAALVDNEGAALAATGGPDSPAAAGKLPAGPARTCAERHHDTRITVGYTQTPQGSYRRDTTTTVAPLSHAGMSKPKRERKKRTKVGAPRYYCGRCHGQVTVSTFSGSRETQESRSSTELLSHSLQQVELKVVSGNIASRGASEILRRLRITQGKGEGNGTLEFLKEKSTGYLKVHRRTSLRLALSSRGSLYTSIRSPCESL